MTSDRNMRTRVVRGGPYTKQNRAQLRHHAGVGAGVGASVGVAGGAHFGAALHEQAAAGAMKTAAEHHLHPSVMEGALRRRPRGKFALAGAGVLGATGAFLGADTGRAVAREQRHQAKREMSKAEPLAIAGKLWRTPTKLSELRRGFKGTRAGEKIVNRANFTAKTAPMKDRYGYTKVRHTGATHGPDARRSLRSVTANEAAHSPHSTSFRAGAKAGNVAGSLARRPEYAISVPAVGAGAGLVHHEVKGMKKGTAVAKSAFGVEIAKDRAKKGAVIGGAAGVAASQADLHVKVHRAAGPAFHRGSFGQKAAAHARVAPRLTRSMVTRRSGPALAANIASGAVIGGLIGRSADKRAQAMTKSAFGVEKGFLTSALDTGVHALKGLKSGLGGEIGAQATAAGGRGKAAGAQVRGALKPIGAAASKNTATVATATGLGGLGVGMATGRKN